MTQHPWRHALVAVVLLAATGAALLIAPSALAQVPGEGPLAEQAPSLEAEVTAIVAEGEREVAGTLQRYQLLELTIATGERQGDKIQIETGDAVSAEVPPYKVGDRVLLTAEANATGQDVLYISDRVRRKPLAVLFLLFVAVVVAVARWRGVASLVAMAFTFVVLFTFLLPRIAAGTDPILAAILTAMVIIPVAYYLSHGVNRKTTAAVVGTLISLAATGVLALVAVNAVVITGYASEEASFLQNLMPGAINIRGLLLASIIIGLSGILDDITISQAAIVAQLRAAAAGISDREVYLRAMDIGRDHIASLVNTLILVYASSALPLLLLFLYSDAPLAEVANYEIVAEEIVRTLVASIGLVLAVPVTTAIAVLMITPADADDDHGHHAH